MAIQKAANMFQDRPSKFSSLNQKGCPSIEWFFMFQNLFYAVPLRSGHTERLQKGK